MGGDGTGVLRRTLFGRKPRADSGIRARGESRRRPTASRRRVQAANFALRVPGLGEEGLKLLAEAREAPDSASSPKRSTSRPSIWWKHYADCMQIGARNMQNFSLLRRAGRSRKPVLLKRGMSSTLGRIPDGRRIHSFRRQLSGDPVRARRAHVHRSQPQHARSERGAGGAETEPSADHRRSQPRHRQARSRASDGAGRHRVRRVGID